MPPVTKNLIIINALIWLVEAISPQFGLNGIIRHLGLHYVGASHFNPAQVLTYMFVHSQSTFFHVLFNMLTLFFFGPMLERIWGGRKFLFYYIVCGVGAALVQEGVWALEWKAEYIDGIARLNGLSKQEAAMMVEHYLQVGDVEIEAAMAAFKNSMVTVGASGAIFGVLLGFAFVFPNVPLYLFFIPVPVKAKYMVAGYAVMEFFFGVSGTMSTVAHFAHLGGMLFGIVLLLYWKRKGKLIG
ncbi:MAG: rhomboid family intramembrane serine protease [Muribaculaceae bacterium]|nr:rhomboid family intramembrane serine protease [Muribaculaceae bacterium]